MASERARDPAWEHVYLANPNDKNAVTCKYCQKVSKGGIYRAKQHLVGGYRNVIRCPTCPAHVREEIKAFMEGKKQLKDQINLIPELDEFVGIGDDEDEDDVVEVTSKKRSSVDGSQRASNNPSKVVGRKPPKQKGPIDFYYTPDPEVVVQNRKGKQMKLDDNNPTKIELRDRACTQFARWMYDAGLSFNSVKYESFHFFIESVGQYGPGMKPPSYHEVRVPLLKKEVASTEKSMNDHKVEWAKNGCSLMADGWQDKRERTLINFLVNSPKGSMFIESVDASGYSKNATKMFELLGNFVEKVGESKVVQVVTDSASANVLAGKISLYLFF